MFRIEALRSIGGYRDEYFTCEDADLYLRLAEIGRLANLPDILLLYRQRPESTNRIHYAVQRQFLAKVVREARIRRGLPTAPEIGADCDALSAWFESFVCPSWANLSRDAFYGGNLETALAGTLGARSVRSPSPWHLGKPFSANIFERRAKQGD
jgi:hypothetical protein